MLAIRKLSHHITPVSSSASFFLLIGDYCNPVRIKNWKSHAYWSHRSISHVKGSYLTNLHMQTMVLEFINEFVQPLQFFSTTAGTIFVQVQLDNAIEEHRLNDTWKFCERQIQMGGFPRKFIVNKLLSSSAESLDLQLLRKAYGLVEKAFDGGKQNLLEKEILIYLSFALAKCGLPVPASTILRKLVEMENFPPVTAWSAIVAHMLQTAPGSYLAAEFILEIGYLFQDGRVDLHKESNAPLIAMKPNTISFNIVLAGCLLSGTTRKAEQLLSMLPQIGVKADATLLVLMAHICERNGHREELKKLQRHVQEAHNLTDSQLRQFFNCLLMSQLNFGDLDSVSQMVLEMLQKAKEAQNSLAAATLVFEDAGKDGLSHGKSDGLKTSSLTRSLLLSYEEFSRDQNFMWLEAEAKEVLDKLLARLQMQVELVTAEHGILQPTEKIYVKLIKAFLVAGKTENLAEFLIKIEKEDSLVYTDDSNLVQVINSCISLGWLDQAHELLNEMHLIGIRTGYSVYASLLIAYIKGNRREEVASLLQDVRKAGVQLDSSCYDTLIESRVLQEDTEGARELFKKMSETKLPRDDNKKIEFKGCAEEGEAKLMAKLLQEIKEEQTVDCGVHDWNNVIHFFSKKRLMKDANKAFRKMRSLGHVPNAQTFHSLVIGYAAIYNRNKVKVIWSVIKSFVHANSMKFDEELLDFLLDTFVRWRFFYGANEVIEVMERENMFVDKYKYRTLLLKYHKRFCMGRAAEFETEGLPLYVESVLAFKKLVGFR